MGDRIDLRRRLNALAFRQAGYFRASQAVDAGYSHQAQKYHVDRGNWMRVDRGLFRIADWPSDVMDVFVRWYVWSNGQGVLSHQTAAEIHGIGGFEGGPVHMTLPHRSQARPEGAVLHVGPLPAAEVKDCGAYRATSILRTLVDLADSDIPQGRLTVALSDASNDITATRDGLRTAAALRSAATALRVERALTELAEAG